VWRNPVLRTLLIAGILLLASVAIVAWDYGLMVRERASTIKAVSDTEVPFVFGVDADTGMTYPKRRVDVWLLPNRDWLIDIGISVGPNAGRTPQRVVIHVQMPGTSLRPIPLRENLPDSFTTRLVPGGFIVDLVVRVPPGTSRKFVDATFAVRSDVPTRKRLGVSTVRLARGSPAFASGLGNHVKDDGLSPPPVLFIHRITTYPVVFGDFWQLDGTPVPDFREPGGAIGWRLDVPDLAVYEPIEVTVTNELARFVVEQIPQLASVAAGLLLGLMAQPLVSRKGQTTDQITFRSESSESLEERMQGYGEMLSDVRQQQRSHQRALVVAAIITWLLIRRSSRRRAPPSART
jgi:hypothetical protein